MTTSEIPITGTPAYWTAQREAVALLHAYNSGPADLLIELHRLRQIAAHGFAARMFEAQGNRLQDMIRDLDQMVIPADENGEEEENPDAPPHGEDWCRRGCQRLFGMECGMCGYDGPGVRADQTDTVAEYCCHCRARTYQSTAGICECCGKDAEDADGADAPACLPQPGRPGSEPDQAEGGHCTDPFAGFDEVTC